MTVAEVKINGEQQVGQHATSYIHKSTKPSPSAQPNVSVPELLASKIQQYDPNLLALIDGNNNGSLTYGELHQQAQEFASALLLLGVTRNDFVMFYGENSLQYVVAMLGSIYLGLGFCPIPPASGPFEITEQTRGANGTVLVFGGEKMVTIKKALNEQKYVDTMKQLRVLIQLDADKPDQEVVQHEAMVGKAVHSLVQILQMGAGERLKQIPHFPVENPSKQHFLICFTSGTTGTPKGAIHTHRSFVANVVSANFGNRIMGEHLIMWHPLGHMSGSFFINYALNAGHSIIVFARSDIEPLLQAVEKYRVISLTISPNQATPLAINDYQLKYDLSSLKCISHGGSVVATSLIRAIQKKYNVATMNVYGSTEFLSTVEGCFSVASTEYKPGCVGQVKPGVEMKVVNMETGASLPPHENGEICARGASCFAGYLRNEEATRSTVDQDGWYHSGDIGYFDEEGLLYYTDRIKEMIKYKLYSVIPAEIEDFIHRHPAVASVCVVGVPHVSDGYLVRAYVQLVEGKSVTEQELIDHVKDNMGSQKQLRAGVRFITDMPRTVIGKVDRQHFKRLVKDELITEQVP